MGVGTWRLGNCCKGVLCWVLPRKKVSAYCREIELGVYEVTGEERA